MNKFNDIGKDPEIKKLLSDQRIFLKKNRDENNTWNEVRDDKNFSLNEKKFPWGTRKIYTPNETKNNYLLQRSRGIDLELDDTNDEMIEKLKKSIGEINEIDKIRIEEIDAVQEHFKLDKFKNFCEIGFRIPKLQNYYKGKGLEELGVDINDYNVRLAKTIGFNCRTFDLNNDTSKQLGFQDSDLIVCYHVLEHLSDPFDGLRKIVESCKVGAFFHFEVPIEPDGPRLWYGHLYPFHPSDLKEMFESLGCKILYASNKTSKNPQGPWIERYSAIKN